MATLCMGRSALGLSCELALRAVEVVCEARRLEAYLAQQKCMLEAYQYKGVTKDMPSERMTTSSDDN